MRSTQTSHLVGLVVAVTGLVALVVTAFAWPVSELQPRDLPVAVVGPPPAAAALQQGADGDALDVIELPSRAAAVAAIEDREVYAGLVLGPETEVLTASAASPAVAQQVSELARELAPAEGSSVTVTDVVPLPEDDPRGLVLAAGSLPLVLGGLAVGAIVALRTRGGAAGVVTALAAAAGAGLATAGVLQGWLGALEGSYWANAGVIALGVAAVAMSLMGLHRVLGLAGLPLGVLTMLLLGNPWSGVTSAPELLPSGWSTLGQLLPPGATGTALRSTAFFEGAGAGFALMVLAAWVVVGAGLALIPRRSSAMADPEPSRVAEPQPA